jgi:hypothetical protein
LKFSGKFGSNLEKWVIIVIILFFNRFINREIWQYEIMLGAGSQRAWRIILVMKKFSEKNLEIFES